MSYKCETCGVVCKNGQSPIVHRIMRDRLYPNGSTGTEIAAEVKLCQACDQSVKDGISVRQLLIGFAKQRDFSEPRYLLGEPRRKLGTVVLFHGKIGNHKINAVVESPKKPKVVEPLIDSASVQGLFRKYGASGYWEYRFEQMTARQVCEQISQHFHLRALWGALKKLVPAKLRRTMQEPQPKRSNPNGHAVIPNVESLPL